MNLEVIILAAGQGTRMKSARPKVIHELAGKPLLQHVIDASLQLEPDQIITVTGHAGLIALATPIQTDPPACHLNRVAHQHGSS